MHQPKKQSLIAMIEAYAASKAEVALESNRPDHNASSLLQKELKYVNDKESLYNFIDKLNLDPMDPPIFQCKTITNTITIPTTIL